VASSPASWTVFTSVEAKLEWRSRFAKYFFQNGFSSTSKAALPVKLELEPFLEELEPSQTGP